MSSVSSRKRPELFVCRGKAVKVSPPPRCTSDSEHQDCDELIRTIVVDARAAVEYLDIDEEFDEELARKLAAAILEAPYDGSYYDVGVGLDIGERHETMVIAVATTVLLGSHYSDAIRRNAESVIDRCPNRWSIGCELVESEFPRVYDSKAD